MYIRVATVVWGEKYTNMMKYKALPSLHQDMTRLREEEGYQVDLLVYDNFSSFLNAEIHFSLTNKDSKVFFAPPDHVWSENSLYNLAKLSQNNNHCFAVPHVRVTEAWESKYPITNIEMAHKALQCGHRTFLESFDDLTHTQCHHGIILRKISDKLIVMKHSLPTVFLVKFNKSDLDFFSSTRPHPYIFGEWDRGWLAKLVKEKRLKIVGGSDIAMTVEITTTLAAKNNCKPNIYDDSYNVDGNWQGRGGPSEHNEICRMPLYSIQL